MEEIRKEIQESLEEVKKKLQEIDVEAMIPDIEQIERYLKLMKRGSGLKLKML